MPHPATFRIAVLALLSALLLAVGVEGRRHHKPASLTHDSHAADRVLLYDGQQPPSNWRLLRPAVDTERLRFTLILKAENVEELQRRFWQRTDPEHELYTEWMTNDEIEQLVRLRPEDDAMLRSELAAHGITAEQVVSHGDSFVINSSVASASSLFSTSFHHFAHSSGLRAIRQHGPCSLRAAIAPLIVMTLDVHTFPAIRSRPSSRRRRLRPASASGSDSASAAERGNNDYWVPQGVAGVYNVPFPIAPLSHPAVTAGVIEWGLQQSFNQSDLDIFSNLTALRLPVVKHVVGLSTEGPGGESTLDIQWIMAMDPGATPWFWQLSEKGQWLSAHHAAAAG